MDDPASWFVAVGLILLAAWWLERGSRGGACCADCAGKTAAKAVAPVSSACSAEGGYV